MSRVFVSFAAGLIAWGPIQPGDARAQEPARVSEVPQAVRRAFDLSPFYAKYTSAGGLPVVASGKVSDRAVQEAAFLIGRMLADREDVRQALIRNKVRFAVMAPDEKTTDIPEHSDLTPKQYWDQRGRGLGATRARPAVSCGEENLLNLRGDRYDAENILVHEFGHAIHEMGLNSLDPKFDARLEALYRKALERGLWKKTYAATNHKEYWAEGVQSYFDTNRSNDAQHNDVATREKLAKYDPDLFALLDDVFRKSKWRYVRYDARPGARPKAPGAPPAKSGRVRMTVFNGTGKPAALYWLREGKPVRYRDLGAGESVIQETYPGHAWRVVVQDRKTPAEFTAPAEDATWRVR